MSEFVFVAIGGAIGAVLRLAVVRLIPLYVESDFPWATMLVNTVGCFALGVLVGVGGARSPVHYPLFGIGILGALTTYSTFSLETMRLFRDGSVFLALTNAFATLAICLCSTGLGVWIAERARGG